MAIGRYNTRKYFRQRHKPRASTTNHKKSCWRKKRYPSEYEALEARTNKKHWQAYDGKPLKVYECTACGGWHLGHEEGWREEDGHRKQKTVRQKEGGLENRPEVGRERPFSIR